jgi:hypothetical protein
MLEEITGEPAKAMLAQITTAHIVMTVFGKNAVVH